MRKIIVDGNYLYVPARSYGNKSLAERLQEGTEIKCLRAGEDTMDGGRIPLVIEYDGTPWLQPLLGDVVDENFKARPAGRIEYDKDYFKFVKCKETWRKSWKVT